VSKIINSYKRACRFTGCSTRSEYWRFILVWFVILVFLIAVSASGPVDGVVNFVRVLYFVYFYLSLVPVLAISVRRHHDAGWSGWWVILSFWSFVLMFFPTKSIGNKYRVENLVSTFESIEPVSEPSRHDLPSEKTVRSKSQRRKWSWLGSVALLLSGVIVCTLIFIDRGSAVSPGSIADNMRKWCDKGTLATSIGVQAVQVLYSGEHSTGVTAALECTRGNVDLQVFFFQTAYDENQYLSFFSSGMSWSGSSAKQYSNPVNVSIGKGFVADYGWPIKNPSTTEGLVRLWMKKTFGIMPKAQIAVDQNWKGSIPPITYSSLGEKGPGSGPAVIN